MSLKVYVAGKWKEREQVKKIMEMFESRGYVTTCDWTKHIAPERVTKARNSGLFTKEYDWSRNEDWKQSHMTYGRS